MLRSFRPSAFVPPGFHVESAVHDGAMTVITVRHMIKTSRCPDCTAIAECIHSRYLRRLADLPLAGRQVRLVVVARRFRCDAAFCRRAIFTERFSADVLAPWARRTARLDCLVHHLGLALGGRPAASFARRLMLPVSNDTLLRVVRRRGRPPIPPPIVVGIDDWAWKRNQRYGTIICDLERRRPIRLLPDREPATAQAWLASQPQIAIVARDRGGGYLPWLDAQWTTGAHNGSELWRRLKRQGFRGCLRVVSEWAGRRRRAEKADAESLCRVPSARTIARLMTTGRDTLSKSESVTIAAIENGVPLLIEARSVIATFHTMIRKKAETELDAWIEQARSGLVTSFANGVAKDSAAVRAAINSTWSNGQTEGQITKLKLVKRQMYGRAKLDLLEARLIGAC